MTRSELIAAARAQLWRDGAGRTVDDCEGGGAVKPMEERIGNAIGSIIGNVVRVVAATVIVVWTLRWMGILSR